MLRAHCLLVLWVGLLSSDIIVNICDGREPFKPPTISFMSVDEAQFGRRSGTANITRRSDGSYIVPPGLWSTVLICNASYPVTWEFHNAHFIGHASWMLNIRTRRLARDIHDYNTYVYSAVVNIYGNYDHLSGNYSCRHVARMHGLRSSLYIFWHANAPNKFIQANESVRVTFDENSSAVLPCVSSDPNFAERDFVLNRHIDRDTAAGEKVAFNNSIRFDDRRGVIFENLPFAAGNYSCNLISTRFEFVKIEVKSRGNSSSGTSTTTFPPPRSNATITYDPETSKLKCCANSKRAPLLIHYYCNHPAMCEFRKNFVLPDTFRPPMGRKSRSGCSVARVYVHSSGLMHCIGDGIDEFRQYTFGVPVYDQRGGQVQQPPIYFNWAEIDPHNLMIIFASVQSQGWYQSSPPFYHGQSLNFYCGVSEYYFSEGIRWGVRWKNKTIQISNQNRLPREQNHNTFYGYDYNSRSFAVQAHVDMHSVLCFAPVWNSTEYISKAYPLWINETKIPIINETLEESFTWTMNDTQKQIHCSAFGIPIPTITWEKSDEWWGLQGPIPNMNVNGNSTQDVEHNTTDGFVEIGRVSYTTNGTYICTATNVGGRMQRKIHIFVREPTSWKKAIAIIVGVVLSLCLLAGTAFLVWRLHRERSVVRQLSSAVTFKDGAIRPEPDPGQTNTNHNFSNTEQPNGNDNWGFSFHHLPNDATSAAIATKSSSILAILGNDIVGKADAVVVGNGDLDHSNSNMDPISLNQNLIDVSPTD